MFKTKTLVTITLIIFWTALVVFATAGVTSRQAINAPVVSPITSGAATQNKSQLSKAVVLTMSEISKHNSGSDCWLLISGKVYDVTAFIPMHPGGESTIITYCGQDATVAFDTKGGRGAHSQNAQNILSSYYIGSLNSSVNQSTVQKTIQNSPSQPPTFIDD